MLQEPVPQEQVFKTLDGIVSSVINVTKNYVSIQTTEYDDSDPVIYTTKIYFNRGTNPISNIDDLNIRFKDSANIDAFFDSLYDAMYYYSFEFRNNDLYITVEEIDEDYFNFNIIFNIGEKIQRNLSVDQYFEFNEWYDYNKTPEQVKAKLAEMGLLEN